MRLKVRAGALQVRVLGALLALLLVSGTIQAAGPTQLTKVSAVVHDNTTTLTLETSGDYVHNEYRPKDDLLLVDLTGVSPGKLRDRVRPLNLPGVQSYRIVGYTGAGGVEIARMELTLAGKPEVRITDSKHMLFVQVTGAATNAAAIIPANSPRPAENSRAAAQAQPIIQAQATTASVKPAEVRHIGIVRGQQGVEIEVTGSAPLVAKAMKLTGPDRIVLDLPNAVPGHVSLMGLHAGDVKDIRMSRYQMEPPVTRVVVDLAASHDYQMEQAGSKLVLKLEPTAASVAAVASATPTLTTRPQPSSSELAQTAKLVPAAVLQPSIPVPQAKLAPEPKGGDQPSPNEFVFVEPKLAPKADNPTSSSGAAAPAAIAATPGETPSPTAAPIAQQTPAPEQQPARLMAANSGPATTPALSSAMPAPTPQQPPAKPAPATTAVNFAAEQQQAPPAATPHPRYTGEPISVNLKDVDLKDFFRLIHEISGLNIVLDPSVSGALTLVLDDVPWDQALDIVLKNNGLERQLEGNVLRISTVDSLRREATARRAQLEAQALAVDKVTTTRFLSYAHAKDVMPTIKRLLSSRGDIVADDRTNALIISDIPSVMPAIDRLLTQLDRKTQEVEIEARVVAATRNFARDIGSQLGWGWGNRPTAVGGAGATTPTGGTVGSPINFNIPNPLFLTSAGNSASIPLFSNLAALSPTSGISFTNASRSYRLDAILTMAESRGLVKILSRPRIITQNNIQAIVKQGTRIPVVTAAQLGGPPTTTYVEAVLRLTVTPQITVENTIFLNVDIENTTPDFGEAVAGNPALLTQQATTQVLVTNGGTVVIGGVIQTKNSVNINQVPLLGNIPLLGNLFKERSVSTNTQELIFFITPRIVET